METLRILAFNWRDITHPEAGGAERDLHEFARITSRLGHEVVLFTERYPGAKIEERLDGYQVVRAGNKLTVYLAARSFYGRCSHRWKFDVLLEDITGIPWFAPMYVREPIVALRHHVVGRTFFQELPLPLAFAGWIAEGTIPVVYKRVPLIVRTDVFRRELARLGFSQDRIHVVPSGLDHDLYRPGGDKSSHPSIVFVGPVKAYKHPEVAMDVVASLLPEFPMLRLDIIGWDRAGLSEELMRQASRLGIREHVTFHGWVRDSAKAQILRRAWLLLQPSEREGWSLAVMEAAACGTPAVATAVGGMRESVKHGTTGFLVPYGDKRSMVSGVRTVLTDEEVRKRLSSGAIEWSRNFSWERYVRETLNVLRGAVCA